MRHVNLVAIVMLVTAVACTPADENGDVVATPPAVQTPGVVPSPTPSPVASGPSAVLGPQWRTDSDGNAVPDFIERELGYDPDADDCALAGGCAAQVDGRASDPLAVAEHGANTMMILDASGSMAGAAGGGRSKMTAAKDAITRYVVGLPAFVDTGLIVYGHRGSNDDADKARSCRGVETFAELGELTHDTVDATLKQFSATGWTPIADALTAAGDVFDGAADGADNRVLLVSDGIETCDGDPVAAAKQLVSSDIELNVDVVGFDVGGDAARQLRRIAKATGGTYTSADTAAQLDDYFDRQRQRIAALNDQWHCVYSRMLDSRACDSDFIAAVLNRIDEERNKTPDDLDRRRALTELYQEMNAQRWAERGERSDISGQRLDELRGQLRAAQRRYRNRFGRETSAVEVDCGRDARHHLTAAYRNTTPIPT